MDIGKTKDKDKGKGVMRSRDEDDCRILRTITTIKIRTRAKTWVRVVMGTMAVMMMIWWTPWDNENDLDSRCISPHPPVYFLPWMISLRCR